MDDHSAFLADKTFEIEIDLVELIGVLMSRLWMIIIFGSLAGIITFLMCVYVIEPKYESTTKMYIINRQSNETLTYSDGTNSVTVKGVSAEQVTLKFGDDGSAFYSALASAGAFDAFTSECIFEESGKGMLASL